VSSFNSVNAFDEKKKKLLFGLLLIVLMLYSNVSTAQWSPTTTSTTVPINRTGFVGIGNLLPTSASGQQLVVGDSAASGLNNIGQLYNGTFGGRLPKDIWSTLGGPPSNLPGNYGLRLNAGQQSINLFLNRPSSTITDKSKAILRWSDNSVTKEDSAQPFFIQSRITDTLTKPPRTIMTLRANGSVGIGCLPTRRFDVVSDDQATVASFDFAAMSQFIYRRNLLDDAGIVGLFVSNGKKNASSLKGTVSKAVIAEAKDAQVNIGVSGSGAGTGKAPNPILNIGVEGFADILNTEGDFTNIGVSGTATQPGVKGKSVSVAIYGNSGVQSGGGASDPQSPSDGTLWAGFFRGDVGITGSLFFGSDKKLKTNIKLMNGSLEKIMKLKPSNYFFNNSKESNLLGLDKSKEQSGFIAQELEKVFPTLVSEKTAPVLTKNSSSPVEIVNYKAVNYVGLIPYMIAATQEQQATIESLQSKLAILESNQIAKSNPTNVMSGITGNLEFVNISPNPTNGLTTVSMLTKGVVNNSLLMIIDLNGKVMEEHPLKSNELDYTFDASKYPKGLYIATFSANGAKPTTRTFVVQ